MKIKYIKDLLEKIHPLPWEGTGNIPFDVKIVKPRESLSKRSHKDPTSWHYDDGTYALVCMNQMHNVIEKLESATRILKEVSEHIKPKDPFSYETDLLARIKNAIEET